MDLIFAHKHLSVREEDVEIESNNDYKPHEEYLKQNLNGELLEIFKDYKYTHENFWIDLYDMYCSRMLFIGMAIGMEFQEYMDEIHDFV